MHTKFKSRINTSAVGLHGDTGGVLSLSIYCGYNNLCACKCVCFGGSEEQPGASSGWKTTSLPKASRIHPSTSSGCTVTSSTLQDTRAPGDHLDHTCAQLGPHMLQIFLLRKRDAEPGATLVATVAKLGNAGHREPERTQLLTVKAGRCGAPGWLVGAVVTSVRSLQDLLAGGTQKEQPCS